MHSQLAVILFADVVGYSAMMESDQAVAVERVRALRDEQLQPSVAAHQGALLKSLGDGWIIGFGSVSACIGCAVDFQNRAKAQSRLRLRIGCHIGEILQDEHDYFGTGLNIAQRIQTEAPPGGVMVSEDLFRQMSGGQADLFRDAGTFRLKNIAQPVRLFQWRPELRRLGSGAGDATSVAVSPIVFAPKDPETEDIAGDLRDQLLIRLSRRQGIVVYDAVVAAAGEPTYDLRSRLRVAGGRGRLSLTLILRADGRPVWSETYEGETDDIFRFCDVVLERAESDLRLQTNAFDGDRLAQVPDEDLSVSELRARAANCFYRVTHDEWSHGMRLMQRAIEMNPNDGVAHAMRCEAAIMLNAARYESMSQDALEVMNADLDRAVEQVPGSDYVFWVRGMFRINCLNDVSGARADLERSRQINPAYVENHELTGHIHMSEGDFAGAVHRFSLLLERQSNNPLRPGSLFQRAVAHYCGGDLAAAASDIRAAIDLRSRDRGLHLLEQVIAEAAGNTALANAAGDRFGRLMPEPSVCARRPVLPDTHRALAGRLAAAVRRVDTPRG